ncbi:hypothetical protein [Arthrobacter sp. CG_A4]|uniref:hypothetical protein n=1 Tax=Arthrobacter sp. CG_A4 TaxID=3071706 RepID=UPI002DFD32AA|nr:hypothetical protein [Arthrobacter sp. CG_A4]
MRNIKKWWSLLAPSSGPAAKAPPDAADLEEWQYWWLLPGDSSYCPSPAATDPKVTVE